ncbi:MAG: 2'-5' RNA ligase family protein [Dyadobacter fermentans]
MKDLRQLSYYTLVIDPDERIINRGKDLKAHARQILGKNFGSISSRVHITLIAFFAYEKDYSRILEEFKRVLAGLKPFEVKLSGFDSFKDSPKCTFFVRPTDETSDMITQDCASIDKHFNKILRRERTNLWKAVGRNRPHMTVVRDASLDDVLKCEQGFTEAFEDHFFCSSFALRRFDPIIRQFEIIDEISLFGHEYIAGQQIRLF